MALEQKRIRELVTYTGSEPTSNVFLPLDSSAFGSEPFKMPIEDLLNDAHTKKGRLTGLVSRAVSVTFGTAFSSTPLMVTLKIYRMHAYGGNYIMKDVLHTFSSANWVNTIGFALDIDASESLTGVIVEFKFEEL